MSTFPYICRELMHAVRGKVVSIFILVFASIFVTLFVFSAFFLLAPASDDSQPLDWTPGTVIVHLIPTATTDEAQSVYAAVRSISGVTQANYLFGEELDPPQTTGVFLVRVDGESFSSAHEAISRLTAVAEVETVAQPEGKLKATVPLTARAVLLALLVLGIIGTLVAARFAYRHLLGAFSNELQLLRLAGTPDATVLIPVFLIGILEALAALVLVVLIVSLLRVAALSSPDGALATSTLLANGGRVLAVLLLNIPLGIVVGSLAGAVGVSLVFSTRVEAP